MDVFYWTHIGANCFPPQYFKHIAFLTPQNVALSGKLDISGRFTKSQVMKAVFGVYMWLMLDENTQVNGIIYLMDFTGFEMKQMLFFGLDDMKKMTKMWQVCSYFMILDVTNPTLV